MSKRFGLILSLIAGIVLFGIFGAFLLSQSAGKESGGDYAGVGYVQSFARGDVNGDGTLTVLDVMYLVSYLFKNGPTPAPLETGLVNCDGKVNIADAVYLICYLFKGGPKPECPSIGTLVSYSDCKGSAKGIQADSITSDQSCIEYQYDGQKLLLKHINAAFNCCPDSLLAEITLWNNDITIVEQESLTHPCTCLCLYDVQYMIPFLQPGVYKIKMMERYLLPGDELLEFNLDLSSPGSGIYCVHRSHYPWGY
jgi:hypothetical protein